MDEVAKHHHQGSGTVIKGLILYYKIYNYIKFLCFIEQIVGGNLDRSSVWYVLRLLQSVPLVQSSGKWVIRGDDRGALLALSAYLGAVKAAVLNYSSIVLYLLSHAR